MLVVACAPRTETASGHSEPDLGWLFLEKGPYTLSTHVDAAPGAASFVLVKDVSLMAATPDTVLCKVATVSADSTLSVELGMLEPGFYQVRLRDSLRWNIGVRPDAVVSAPDAPEDFDVFWETTFQELAQVPLEPEYKELPEYSNEVRTCYEVRYASWGGAVSGGIVSIPNAPGKYPVQIMYMGYGAEPYYMDPNAYPEQIQFLVSVRDQRAVDFAASLDKADVTRMAAWGESQGGAFTFLSAAVDSRIKAIAPSVPFLGDYEDYARIVWWPVHEVFETADAEGISREQLFAMLRYFDIKNFAPKVKCPVYMSLPAAYQFCHL